jgi:hypothetical protein
MPGRVASETLDTCGAGVPSYDAAQRGVRFQRRRVNADRFALDQARIGEPLQNPREHGFVRFEIDQATGCAKSSNDLAAPPAAPTPGTREAQTNRPPARRWRAPRPSLRSSRSAAIGGNIPTLNQDGRSRRLRLAGRVPRRSRRNPLRRGSDAIARRRGVRYSAAGLESLPTSTSASDDAVVCPSPCARM